MVVTVAISRMGLEWVTARVMARSVSGGAM